MSFRITSRSLIALASLTLLVAALAGCGSKAGHAGSGGASASGSTGQTADGAGSTTAKGGSSGTSSSGAGSGNARNGTGSSAGGSAGGSGSSSAGGSSGDSGSGGGGPSTKDTSTTEPPPIQLLAGDDTGIHVSKPTVIVAQSDASFNSMIDRHFSHGVKRVPVVGTDFRTRQMVGLFLPKSGRGVEMQITHIYEQNGYMVVEAVKLLRGKGCKAPARSARPFHIVETRKMRGKVKLKLTSQPSSPC